MYIVIALKWSLSNLFDTWVENKERQYPAESFRKVTNLLGKRTESKRNREFENQSSRACVVGKSFLRLDILGNPVFLTVQMRKMTR